MGRTRSIFEKSVGADETRCKLCAQLKNNVVSSTPSQGLIVRDCWELERKFPLKEGNHA